MRPSAPEWVMDRPETICVVGLWHLGSVVAGCWADLGHRVMGIDESPAVVEKLAKGAAPLFEPGLDELIRTNLGRGRLSFTTDLAAVGGADVVFVAFDTPVDADDRLDLAPLERTVERFAGRLKPSAVIVVSSQVPVGTCARWREQLRQARGRPDVDVAYPPDNLRLGDALRCYLQPDRIVLGAE